MRGRWIGVGLIVVALLAGCEPRRGDDGPATWPVPDPDIGPMQPRVAQRIVAARQRVLQQPDSAVAWGSFAAVLDAHDLFDHAVPAYRRARALAPDDFRWPYMLAIVREQQGGEGGDVIRLFEEAARLAPDFPAVSYRLGEALMRQGRLDEAHVAYTRALEIDPALSVAYLGRGQLRIELGRPDEALKDLEQALRLGGEDGRIFTAMARAHARNGDPERAREAAERSVGKGETLILPDSARLYVKSLAISSEHCYRRAKQMMFTGKFAEALEQLLIVEESRPRSPGVQHRIGICYSRTGRPEEAIRHLTRAIELKEDRAEAYVPLAALLATRGESERAVELLRQGLDRSPGNPALERALAEALERGSRE